MQYLCPYYHTAVPRHHIQHLVQVVQLPSGLVYPVFVLQQHHKGQAQVVSLQLPQNFHKCLWVLPQTLALALVLALVLALALAQAVCRVKVNTMFNQVNIVKKVNLSIKK